MQKPSATHLPHNHLPQPQQTTGDLLLSWLARLGTLLGSGMVLATAFLWLRNGAAVDLGDTLGTLGDLLMALACSVVAGLILTQRPRHRIGWLLLAIGLLWSIEWFGEAYARYAFVTLNRPLPGASFLIWFSSLTWVPGFGLVIWLILLFPTGHALSWHWNPIGVAATLLTLTNSVFFGFFSWPLRGPQMLTLLAGDPAAVASDAAGEQLLALMDSPIGVTVPLAFLLLLPATVALFLGLRRTQGVERQQVKWFAYAVLLFTLTMTFLLTLQFIATQSTVGAATLPALWELLYVMAPPLLPVAIGIAILRHRLWDIDLIIRRTLVYGLLTGMVIGVYVLIVAGVGALLAGAPVAAAQGEANPILPTLPLQLAAAGAVAVLFQPARQWLQQRVNRLLYGEIDEPYAVVARLGQQLEATIAPQSVLTATVETVRSALKLPYVGVRVTESDLYAESSKQRETPPTNTVTLPLLHQGNRVGELLLAPRVGETDFSAADRRLLDGLARQAGAAIQALRLTADLQQARQRLVATREEERRRLRRDLHDALGAALASIAMQADAAGSLIDEEPAESKALLAGLTQQAQATLADIRRLIYNLRPPALDDLGLIAALRQLTAAHAQSGIPTALHAPDQLPALPAAVEVAAYRIVQEALTNVVRHAQATACAVQVVYRVAGEWDVASELSTYPPHLYAVNAMLQVEITDDGIGLSPKRTAGVGTSSMRERAEELGGVLTLAAQPTGGTRVTALLPIG